MDTSLSQSMDLVRQKKKQFLFVLLNASCRSQETAGTVGFEVSVCLTKSACACLKGKGLGSENFLKLFRDNYGHFTQQDADRCAEVIQYAGFELISQAVVHSLHNYLLCNTTNAFEESVCAIIPIWMTIVSSCPSVWGVMQAKILGRGHN